MDQSARPNPLAGRRKNLQAGPLLRLALAMLIVAATPAAATAQSEVVKSALGTIVALGGNPGLEDVDGKKWSIEGDSAICFKYIGMKIEVLDPIFSTAGSVRFTKYRILESEVGRQLPDAFRRILSTKSRQPEVSVHVRQEGSELLFSLTLSNPNKAPVMLKFPSTQMYDFAVMTTDEKTTLWRWSWNGSFQVGHNELKIQPRGEVRWEARWDFTQSYVQEGEYIAFGEVHCLPHGILSPIRHVVLRSERPKVLLPQYFLPLDEGLITWQYRTADAAAKPFDMRVTGKVRLDGNEYAAMSFFPDEKSIGPDGLPDVKADSRLIRFDKGSSRFLEWSPLGEKPLLMQDANHRFQPVEGECRTAVGTFDRAMAYQIQKGGEWQTRLVVVPGIGIVQAVIPRAAGGDLALEMVSGRTVSSSAPAKTVATTAAAPAAASSSPAAPRESPESPKLNFKIVLKRSGGLPPQDNSISITSDGTLAVLENGKLVRQAAVRQVDVWNIVQVLDRAGFYQLADKYGQDDLEDPLTVEIAVDMDGKAKTVFMRTSAKEKPPMSFWKIVDAVEGFARRAK